MAMDVIEVAAGGPGPWLVGGAVLLGVGVAGLAASRRKSPGRRRSGRAGPGRAPSGESDSQEPSSPDRPPSVDRALGVITFRDGPLRGNRFSIPAGGLRIGRDASACQVVLSEVTVSRRHAHIGGSGGGAEVVIRNLSGTNPTYVNDRAVQEAVLRDGDQVRIGSSVLHFRRP